VHHFLQKPVDREVLRAVVEQGAARLVQERSEQRILAVLRKHPDLRALLEATGDWDGTMAEPDEPLLCQGGRPSLAR
jgi:hypothetical protein